MPSKILNFNKDRLITGINIIDGMLFFTDNETEPKKINIEKFKGNKADAPIDHSSGTTHIYNRPFEERDITVIKEHPIKTIQTFTTSIAGYGGGDIIDIGDGASYYDSTYSGENDTIGVPTVTNNGLQLNFINRIIINGSVLNSKDLREVGFYYTFDPEYATKDAIISQVPNKTFKVTKQENKNDTLITFQQILEASSPGMGSITAGTEFYFLAYAYDASYPESEIYANEVSDGKILIDPTASTTISNFKVEAKYTRQTVLSSLFLRATFDGGETDIIGEEFLISDSFSIIPNTPPTAAEIIATIKSPTEEFPPISDNDLFPAVREADIDIFENQIGEFSSREFVNLTAGLTYYVYGKITLDSGEEIYSGNGTTPAVFTVSDGIKSIPAVQHIDVSSYSNKIILEAEVLKLNDPSRQALEIGFLVSKNIRSLEDLKLAFVDGANVDGTPVQSGHTDTFKVLSTNQLNSDGTGIFEYDTTTNFGTLQPEETIYYVAFAKNQSGAIGYGSKFGYINTGELAQATTIIEGTEPVINLNAIGITRPSLSTENYDIDFEFELNYMPNNTAPQDVGIVAAMPTGGEIGGGIFSTFDRLQGFKSIEEIDNGNKKIELVKSDFTFSSNGDSTFLGKYTKLDQDFENISKQDTNLWANIIPGSSSTNPYSNLGNSISPTILAYDPHTTAFSAYAYVVYNNKTYYSNIVNGGKDSNNFLNFDLGLDDGIPDLNFGAPTIKTSNKKNQGVTNAQDTQVTLEGRIADNNGIQGASPINEIGFYYGTTDPGLSQIAQTDDYHTKIESWISLGTTTKQTITVTSQMQNWHTQSPKPGWLEFDYTLTSQTAGSTIYFVAFVKPTQSIYTGIYSSVINDYNNRTKYGNLVAHTFNPNHTSLQSGDEPRVIIKNVEKRTATSSGVDLLFIGEASEIKDYYNITTKGFYYKAASVVEGTYGANPTAANVKTANGSATNRTTLSKTDFNENDPAYAVESVVGFGEYYVSSFCITTTNGNTETFISNNFKKVNITAANSPIQQDTSPGVSTSGSNSTQFPILLQGRITKNNVNISEKGFYIIGKKDDSFSRPANGAALKAIYDSPGSGVIVNKINNATGGTTFSKTFSAQKRGYTYYFVAYAKNSGGEETIATNVSRFFLAENVAKFIRASTSIIIVEENGEYLGQKQSFGSGAYLIITTEKGSDSGNWKIVTDPVWHNTNISVNVVKKIIGGKPVLYFPPQYANNSTKDRRSTVTIQHDFDPTVSTSVSLRQKGATNVNVDTTTSPLYSPGKEKPKNILKEK